MSRSSYSDDFGDDYPGQLNLYRANVDRSIYSKSGQARLRELREALVALPDKRLADEVFAPKPGEACALGVWAQAHQVGGIETFQGDDHETAQLLKPRGWPKLVVLEAVYQNDGDFYTYEDHLGPHQNAWEYRDPRGWPVRIARRETDEERYVRVLAWVNEQIQEPTR